MAKKIVAKVKLQIPAGAANPSPPVGPALGQHGLNIMGFCKEFNARTASQKGMIIPGSITMAQVEEIAKTKMPDLNAASLEAAVKTIMGTARSMGVDVK